MAPRRWLVVVAACCVLAAASADETLTSARDCAGSGAAAAEFDASTSRYMRENTQEVVAILLAPIVIVCVLMGWSTFINFSSSSARSDSDGSRTAPSPSLCSVLPVVGTVVAFVFQRYLYIMAPTEFTTDNRVDVANLCASSVAVALATVWVAYLFYLCDQPHGAIGLLRTAESKSACCNQGAVYQWVGLARGLARVMAIVCWLLDVNRRTGWVVATVGYFGIGIAVLVPLWHEWADCKRRRPSESEKVGMLVASCASAALLTAVMALRPCRGYD
jgi:hypothetical protein